VTGDFLPALPHEPYGATTKNALTAARRDIPFDKPQPTRPSSSCLINRSLQMDWDEERIEAFKENRRKSLESDFVPFYHPMLKTTAEERIAMAMEYMAFQIGQTNKKLDAIIEALASRPAQS
jgi:hypothetical protein